MTNITCVCVRAMTQTDPFLSAAHPRTSIAPSSSSTPSACRPPATHNALRPSASRFPLARAASASDASRALHNPVNSFV